MAKHIDLVSFIIEWGLFWQFLILQEFINKLNCIFTATTTKKPKQKKADKGQNKGNRIKKQILSNDSYPFSLTLILENLYKQIMSHSKTSIGVNFTFTV